MELKLRHGVISKDFRIPAENFETDPGNSEKSQKCLKR